MPSPSAPPSPVPEKVSPVSRREWWCLVALVLFGIAIRAIHLTQPFVDEWSWRQSDDAMIALNYYRHGFHFLLPQVSWAGGGPGYVGTEFPLLTYSTALLYTVFGVHEWVGRAMVLLSFGVSIPFFYGLARHVTGPRAALLGTGVYVLTPLGLFAGREFMPDMPSVSLSLAALYGFVYWLRSGNRATVLLAGLAAGLAIAIKPPAILIGLPLLWMVWRRFGWRAILEPELWAFTAAALLPAALWFRHAWQVSAAFFPHHFFGEGGISILGWAWYGNILGDLSRYELSPLAFAGLMAGLTLRPRGQVGPTFHWWTAGMVTFIILAGWGNRHEWYRLPLVPSAAALTGVALDRLLEAARRRSWNPAVGTGLLALFFLLLAGQAYAIVAPMHGDWDASRLAAARITAQVTAPDALVAVADNGDPTVLYYADRRGRHFPTSEEDGLCEGTPADAEDAIANLEMLRKEGVGYLLFFHSSRWMAEEFPGFQTYLDQNFRRAVDTPDCLLFDLSKKRGAPAPVPPPPHR